MTLEKKIGSAFKMDDDTWMKHANPWNGWTDLLLYLYL